MFNETEILDSRESPDTLAVEAGTIGWEDDPDPHYDINQDSDDGVTLVKVQLFRGRVPGTTPKKSVAQGHKIIARLNAGGGGMWSVPRVGKQCVVQFPAGFSMTPGGGVISGIAGAYINDQFREDREIWDAGADRDVLIKGRRVAIQDYDGNFLCVSPDTGIQAVDKDGNGYHIKDGTITIFASSGSPPDAKTLLTLSASEIALMQKDNGGAFLTVKNGEIGIQAKSLAGAMGQTVLGTAGQEPVVTLTKLLLWLNSHVHAYVNGASPAVTAIAVTPATTAIASTSTFVT